MNEQILNLINEIARYMDEISHALNKEDTILAEEALMSAQRHLTDLRRLLEETFPPAPDEHTTP